MRLRTLYRLTGTTFLLAIAIAFALAVAAGCGSRPGSPEALYAKIAEYNAAGETGKIWDLLTDDARQQQRKVIDDFRVTLARNPGTERLVAQWECTKEEFMTLPHEELYRRENLGNERAFVDAKIKGKHADPTHPGDEILEVENPLGTTFYLRMRPVAGGWGLVEISPRAK